MGKALSKVIELCEGEGGLRPPFAITFQEEGHQYQIDGVSVPSVTQVVDQLHNFTGPPNTAAMERGTIIHKACELLILGILDWSTIDESIKPEVETFAAWWESARFKPLLVEGLVGSKRYMFAGRLDLFGVWKTGLALIDFKTGNEYPAYKFQTAGLEVALVEAIRPALAKDRLGLPPIQRYCLYLKGDKARPVEHTDPRDHSRFLAALTCSHTRRELYP
jgi:hypothetical protein